MTVGDRIKELRRDNGLTQKELANAMGVTASMIGQYETGIRTPKYETLERIAKALSVSVPMLMGEYYGRYMSNCYQSVGKVRIVYRGC